MANLNKIQVIGNVGKDAALRYTANGTATAGFSVAVNHNRRNQAGDWESQTEWFNIVMFGESAERLCGNIIKGKSVYVEGRLQTRAWDDQEGVKRTSIEIVANNVQLLGTRDSDDSGSQNRHTEETLGNLPFE